MSDLSSTSGRTDEEIEDLVASTLTDVGNISITHDDPNNQIKIDTSALDQEEVEDAVNTLMSSSGNLAYSYDDANDTLTVSLSGPITGVDIGSSTNPVPAVYTDELSNVARFISAGTSLSEINTELSKPGTVIFEEGDHFVSDTIQIGTGNLRIVVRQGAHIKLADAASPTLVTDQQNTDHAVLLRNQGYNDVSLNIRGNVDANNANHTNPIQVLWESGHNGYIATDSGRLTGGGGGVWLVDSDNIRIPSLDMIGPGDGTGAPLNMEGCRHATVDCVTAVDAGEVVDLNAYNEDCSFGAIHGHNLSGGNEVVDINASPRTTIKEVKGSGSQDGLVTIQGDAGNRFSNRADPGNSDDVKISRVVGTAANRAIYHAGGQTKNLELRNLDVESTSVSGNHAVELQPGASGALDGLVVTGRIRQTGDARGLQLGSGSYVQDGVYVNAEVFSSSSYSASLDNFKNVSGEIRCFGGSTGVQLFANQTIRGHELTVLARDGTNTGLVLSGSGTITGEFYGYVTGWNTDVEIGSVGSDVRLDIKYGSLTDNGTGTVEAQYA